MQMLLNKLYEGKHPSHKEIDGIFTKTVPGNVDEITLSSFLTAFKIKSETPEKTASSALSLRSRSRLFGTPEYLFSDSCGTGGDNAGIIKISTAAAFLAAECGLPIVKPRNRSVSSKCGLN